MTTPTRLDELITLDPNTAQVFGRVERLAACAEPVLVLGETGTGKEGIASAIHSRSPRARGPFEVLNCGELHGDVATSELLGHERGAFTGAERTHRGVFERGSDGTVFLDEVGELSPSVQARLLRVLETRQVRRIGGTRPFVCDFRLVCATHRDLAVEVAEGRFRRDLFYRLGVILLRLPPLRARPADVPLLARHFLAEAAPDLALDPEALDALQGHAWPGNVRELRNVIRRMAVEAEGGEIRGEDVRRIVEPPARRSYALPPAGRRILRPSRVAEPGASRPRSLSAIRRTAVRTEVARQEGNVAAAARVLRVARSTVYDVLREHPTDEWEPST